MARNSEKMNKQKPSTRPDQPENKPETSAKSSLEEISLQLIIHGGNARAAAHKALKAAKIGLFEEAEKLLKKADDEIQQGHEIQTRLLQSEENGAKMPADLLFVHAHGHLMTAMSEKVLIEELVSLHKQLRKDFLHFS